jgi:tRNA modification GTPase
MIEKDTIYALSTVLGKSGVAIIRVSGSLCSHIAKLYNFKNKVSAGKIFRHKLISILDSTFIDDCLIACFNAPHSFTGEDILEFHTHGSVAVIKKIISEFASIDGMRIASPGEFSKRAFLNGKMDLSQAEGLASLIEAETEIQRQVASRQMLGEQGNLYEKWRISLITIMAQLEALIDFPTEDIPENALNYAEQEIDNTISAIKKHLEQGDRSEIIQRGIRIAIVGDANVGKSTLLNALARRDVAITSEIAGTTRDIIEVKLDIAGYPFIIYDTAGIRESLDTIEQEGIKRSYRAIENADLCLLVIDATSTIPQGLVAHIKCLHKPFVTIYNKIDLNNTNTPAGSIRLSLIENGFGLDNIIEYLKDYASDIYAPISDPLLTSERHRTHLVETLYYLNMFDTNDPIDISSQYIRMSARSLGQIVGKIDVNEVLDTIFSSFCIGK